MNDRIRRRLELRRSSAATPHRNKTRFAKATRNDWKGLVMSEDFGFEDIVVQREGSSQRTVEELLRLFVSDCFDLTGQQRFGRLLAEFDEAYAKDNGGYEALCFENLHGIADDAESWLTDAGYGVEWNDGYIIYKA
jgi:hypothetical protein